MKISTVSGVLARAAVLAAVIGVSGCQRTPYVEFQPSKQAAGLPAELQAKIKKVLDTECGTVLHPKMLGNDKISTDRLLAGREVYLKRCAQCHGATGDGQGPAAEWLNPKPRDYRLGKFKFSSTPFDNRPLRSDMVRTVRNGVSGTSMPAFPLLAAKDVENVVDYVLVLTHRGELETQLAAEADASQELPDEMITELKDLVIERWAEADTKATHPLSNEPKFTIEQVIEGKKAFLSRGCSKCHGEDGRGQTADNLRGDLKDGWGHATKAADLTSGLLHGGRHPEDVYRRIYNGITGTPMPSFQTALASEPETFWNLVAYVLYVSNRRRAGEIPEAGLMSLPADAAATATPAKTD
ncbi:MAG: c-type cytochrome [Planctomycetes bacterium]|nr:c-type cytochrome [Planctomycetota bacterium]